MTATPIPRTLRLTQFGDLDLTTIRTIPVGRKGIKTRIVEPDNLQNYYSFLKTRLELNEQVFIVVPAIEESESGNLENIDKVFQQYKVLFPEFKIDFLHGKMKAEEKDHVINHFAHNKIDLLVATSVIEVGINIPTATVISIYNPERFGLSSLHQLRGRVGRGDKTGFCFLVTLEQLNLVSKSRLQVLEDTTDGFIIAEKDLEFRGEGDLFGRDQSGVISNYKLADIFKHRGIFEQVTRDLSILQKEQPAIIDQHIQKLIEDAKIASTI
jgi:ATP-dependent DNA helicase RecG